MPWLKETKKDVAGCDKPRGAAKQAVSRGFPNGETHERKTLVPAQIFVLLGASYASHI